MMRWLFPLAFLRLSIGGDGGGSSSSSATTTNTQNVDRRQVVDGGSIGVTADGSTVTVNSTRNDLAPDVVRWTLAANNEATWRAAALANESGARAAALANESGARAAALANESTARAAALVNEAGARDLESVRVSAALANEATARAAALANESSARAFDLAANSNDNGRQTLQAALGFATDALTRSNEITKGNLGIVDKVAASLSNAYENVADVSSGNKQLVTMGLIVAGIVAAAALTFTRKAA